MNLLKSIFITLTSSIWVFATLHISQYLIYDFQFLYLINLAVYLTPLIFLLKLFRYQTPRTSRQLWPVTLVMGLAWAWILFNYLNNNRIGDFDFFLTSMSAGLWVLYLTWYSRLGKRINEELESDKRLPELKFLEVNGTEVSNREGNDLFTIYLFYRGNWCPLCMAQIKEIATQYEQIKQLGVRVALVSPQPMGYIKKLAKRTGVEFSYWQDPENKVARQLGIDHRFGTPMGFQLFGYNSETVLPILIVTDAGGTILFSDQTDNYRVRPEPETFMRIIKKHIKASGDERIP